MRHDEYLLVVARVFLREFAEAAQVRLVERRVDFVEDGERRARDLHRCEEQRNRDERAFAARILAQYLRVLAGEARLYVDAAVPYRLALGHREVRLAAAEQLAEYVAEAAVDAHERLGELPVRHRVGVGYEPLYLAHARTHVVELFAEEGEPVFKVLVLRQNAHVDVSEGFYLSVALADTAAQLFSSHVLWQVFRPLIGILFFPCRYELGELAFGFVFLRLRESEFLRFAAHSFVGGVPARRDEGFELFELRVEFAALFHAREQLLAAVVYFEAASADAREVRALAHAALVER